MQREKPRSWGCPGVSRGAREYTLGGMPKKCRTIACLGFVRTRRTESTPGRRACEQGQAFGRCGVSSTQQWL